MSSRSSNLTTDTEPSTNGSAPSRLRAAVDLGILAAAVALSAAFIEVGLVAGRLALTDAIVWASRDYGWFTPLSWLVFFALPGAAAAVAMAMFPGRRVWSVALAAFVALATFGLMNLFLYQKLHTAAIWLIAVGVGVQAARLGAAHRQSILRSSRWVALGLGLLTGAIAAGTILWPPVREIRELARLPEPTGDRPNVLVIILDTVRAASLSLYGYDRPTTPRLEEWAERGVVFDEAWSTAPWTLPGHGTIFAGLYPYQFTGDWVDAFDTDVPILAEVFRDEGYRTGGFVANLYYAAWGSGLDRGFTHYEDYLRSKGQLLLNSALGQSFARWRSGREHKKAIYQRGKIWQRRFGPLVTDAFTRWLDSSESSGRPFFAFLNYYAAHRPYLLKAPFARQFVRPDEPDASSRLMSRYDAAIAYLDDELDQLFRDLEQRGELDNTWIVVTSDHGELFGEHGLDEHGQSLYDPVLHVPLLIIPPRGEQRTVDRVSRPVSLRDLAATLVDGAGLPETMPGVSLRPFWHEEGGAPEVSPVLAQVSKGIRTPPSHPVTLGPMYSLRDGPWHLILNGDCREELYNLYNDPLDDVRERFSGDSIAELREDLYTAFPAIKEGPCGSKAP